MARRKIKTAIKRRLEFMSMARTSKKNRKKRAKAKSKTNKALAKNAYRRFTISAGTANLVIPNPKGLGTLYFQLDTSMGVVGEVALSVMVL